MEWKVILWFVGLGEFSVAWCTCVCLCLEQRNARSHLCHKLHHFNSHSIIFSSKCKNLMALASPACEPRRGLNLGQCSSTGAYGVWLMSHRAPRRSLSLLGVWISISDAIRYASRYTASVTIYFAIHWNPADTMNYDSPLFPIRCDTMWFGAIQHDTKDLY